MAAATLGSATAWLLTYAIHSSVLIGLALILSRRLGERRLALQETLIRAAVLGAIATSTIQRTIELLIGEHAEAGTKLPTPICGPFLGLGQRLLKVGKCLN